MTFFGGVFAEHSGASGDSWHRIVRGNFAVGRVGSEFVGGIFAKYSGASGGSWQRVFRGNFAVWGLGRELFGGTFAKCSGASGASWQQFLSGISLWGSLAANLSVELSLSTLGPVGTIGSELFLGNFAVGGGNEFFGGIFAKYSGASEGSWQRIFQGNFVVRGLGFVFLQWNFR